MKTTRSVMRCRVCCFRTGRSELCSSLATFSSASSTRPSRTILAPREVSHSRRAVMHWKAAVAGAVLVAAAGLACRDATNPEQNVVAPQTGPVPGEYIVVFQPGVANPAVLAAQLVRGQGGTLRFTYTSALKGFAATLPAAAAQALAHNPLVSYVEQDQVYRVDVTQSMDANGDPWGLDRVDQQAGPLSRTYTYTATGAGVHAYIIDTGIWTLHPDFGGRANNVYDAFGATGEDCHGHGTHVAGTIGGTTYGLAKGVSLHGVRVLSCAGLGLTSQIIAGIDWVRQNTVKPAVANMSLGGGRSTALNELGQLRRGVRPGIGDRLGLPAGDDDVAQRDIDGVTAFRGRGGALQGHVRRSGLRDGIELDRDERDEWRDYGESGGDAE